MVDSRRALGKHGETLAATHLQRMGFNIVAQNWRCTLGEIDIIATETGPDYSSGVVDALWLVLVEVRTRRGTHFGSAKQSVTARKQAKLRELAAAYLRVSDWHGPWRIDVVAVQLNPNALPAIEHIRHAVPGV